MRSEAIIVFAAAAVVAGSASAAPAKQQPVVISFELAAGGKRVDCGHDIEGLGSTHVNAKLREASFYISDPALIDKSGKVVPIELARNDWQYANVALIDFDDKTGNCRGTAGANTIVTGQAPAGRYQGISFVIGVPALGKGEDGKEVSLNHSNFATAPAPLDIQSMSWGWQAGRKFIKLELAPEGGIVRPPMPPRPQRQRAEAPVKSDQPPESVQNNPDGTITVATWMLHLGSTGCKGDAISGEIVACASPNRIPVTLARFDPAKQRVVLDLQDLLRPFDLNRDKGGSTGCMSGPTDPECTTMFEILGLDAKNGGQQPSGAGKIADIAAKIFKAESK